MLILGGYSLQILFMNTTQKRPWYGTVLSVILGFNTLLAFILFVYALSAYLTMGETLKPIMGHMMPMGRGMISNTHALAAQWASMLLPIIIVLGFGFIIDAVLAWGTWVGKKWAPFIVAIFSGFGILGAVWGTIGMFTRGAFYPTMMAMGAHGFSLVIQIFVLTIALLCLGNSYYTYHQKSEQ